MRKERRPSLRTIRSELGFRKVAIGKDRDFIDRERERERESRR